MLYLSRGNLKLQADNDVCFFIFNLPSSTTCPGSTALCRKHCYAKKAERQYPNTIKSRENNLALSKKDSFVKNLTDIIDKKTKNTGKKIYFRIHESGDFYSEKYFKNWLEVINLFPCIKFLAFTKAPFIEKYLNLIPDNFNLFYSIWKDTTTVINDLPKAYTDIEVKGIKKCSGKCNKCLHCFEHREDVYFDLH